MKSLDVPKVESGMGGVSQFELVAGNVLGNPVTRFENITANRETIGESDGYDLTSTNNVDLYVDVALGAATYIDLHVVTIASEKAYTPEPVAGENEFDAGYVYVDPSQDNILLPVKNRIRFTSSGRYGPLRLQRPANLIKFEVNNDSATIPTGGIALAAQGVYVNE